MANINWVSDYIVPLPEIIEGSRNKIKTEYDIEVRGQCNRIQAIAPCVVRISGRNNTVYGNGDVYVEGEGQTVSSTTGSKISFRDSKSKQEYVKIVTSEEEGKPFALINGVICPVIRHHQRPFLATELNRLVLDNGETIIFYEVSLGDKIQKYYSDPNGNFYLVHIEKAAVAKIKTRQRYSWVKDEELENQILKKISDTQTITYAEGMLLGFCEEFAWQSAIKEAANRGINEDEIGLIEFPVLEGLEIAKRNASLVGVQQGQEYGFSIIKKIEEALI